MFSLKKFLSAALIFAAAAGVAAEKNYAPAITRWKTPNGFKLVKGEGPNGTVALYHQRTDKSYVLAAVRITGLKPRTKYRFGVKIKTRNVSTVTRGYGATVCIELEKNGKYAGGAYPQGMTGTADWRNITGTVITPDGKFHATMALYMRKGHTGEAWYAEPFIEEDKPEWYSELISPRTKFAITPGKQTLVFHSLAIGLGSGDGKVSVELFKDGKQISSRKVPVVDGKYAVEEDLTPGNYLVKAAFEHPDLKEKLVSEIKFKVLADIPGNAVRIDDKGRMVVNGKKFLPVGIFTNQTGKAFDKSGNVLRREDIERLKKSPFNTILPYDGHYWKRESDGKSSMAVTREIMSEFNDAGIKTIISLKDVHPRSPRVIDGKKGVEAITAHVMDSLKDHPGLLAWYLNDESVVTQFRIDQREKVSALDPLHPTLQCQYDPAKFAQCASGADIFSVDPYPVERADSDMQLIQRHFDALEFQEINGSGSAWGIPQIFPWHNYSKVREYCLPSDQQIRSMNILMAIRGAKGFIFYSYMDLLNPDLLKRDDYNFEAYWQTICRTAQMLRDLSDHLLSDAQAPEVQVKNQGKSPVVARAFADDSGKNVVLIAAVGSGESQAEITVKGKSGLRSKYGKTVEIGNGVYRFSGMHMDSDILY